MSSTSEAQALLVIGLVAIIVIHICYIGAVIWAAGQAKGLSWYTKLGMGIPMYMVGIVITWVSGILVREFIGGLVGAVISSIVALVLVGPYSAAVAAIYKRVGQGRSGAVDAHGE